MNVLWTSYFGLLKDHFGDFGLLRDHFGECAVEELLLQATQRSLWRVCCRRATALGYSEITLASVL